MSERLPAFIHHSLLITHHSSLPKFLRRGLRQRAEKGDAEQALAQSPQRRVRHGVPLAPYGGHDPAQVFGDGAPLPRRVARRARVLGDGLFIECERLVEGLFLVCFGAYAARDLGGVGGVVALDLADEHVGAQLFAERAYAKVEAAQARDLKGSDEGPRARRVAEHDRRADRQRFERAARLREDEVVFGENLLRLSEQVAVVLARNVEREARARARLAHDRDVVEYAVAEDERAARLFGERRRRGRTFRGPGGGRG